MLNTSGRTRKAALVYLGTKNKCIKSSTSYTLRYGNRVYGFLCLGWKFDLLTKALKVNPIEICYRMCTRGTGYSYNRREHIRALVETYEHSWKSQ